VPRPRVVRRLAGLSVVALLACGYYVATEVEQRRMSATELTQTGAVAPLRIDAARLVADVEALSAPAMEGRRTGTPGNHRAQAFITARFRELGLKPAGQAYEQKFSFVHRSIVGTVMPGRPAKTAYPDATNLAGVVRGTARPDDVLMVTAHYDHLGIRNGALYPGADDNASGVATMLQIAAYVAAHPARHSVVFVAFDGEEQGLEGAKYFVAHPPVDLKRIRLMINLDMVSRSDTATIVASGTAFDPTLKDLVTRAAAGRGVTVAFGHDRPVYVAGGVEDWTQQSDQGPFHDAGVRTLYYGVEDHADYHEPTDTADRIPRPFFTQVAELVLQTLLEADASA
jgi:Zn-dependent M28 family amino/carboxypeptidase